MTTFYRRRRLSGAEKARAAGLALGAGAVVATIVFYLARILLGRDRLPPPGPGADGSAGS